MGQNTEKTIQIKTQLRPAIYSSFQCIADRCQNNCCHDWNIRFSKKDYLKVKRAPKTPELEELARQAMHRLPDGQRTLENYAEFCSGTGKCALQQENGLCALQLGCGEETLPLVCRQFPRHKLNSPMGRLHSLSTACEAVVELLWNTPEGMEFCEDMLPKQQWYIVNGDNNLFFHPVLMSTSIDILQERRFSLSRRLMILGLALETVRNQGFEKFQPDEWLTRVHYLLSEPSLSEPLERSKHNLPLYLAHQYRTIFKICRMRKGWWETLVNRVGMVEYTGDYQWESTYSVTEYQKKVEIFDDYFGDISYFWENLMVNTFYFLALPDVSSPEKLWKSYVNLCNLYSLFRFTAIINCGESPSQEKLFEAVVMVSRGMIHNKQQMALLQDEFFNNDSSSLSHMAILVQG